MITKRSTFFLGLFIVLLSTSFIALPSWWKTFFVVICGLILMGMSVKFSVLIKSVSLKHHPKSKPKQRSEKVKTVLEPTFTETPSEENSNIEIKNP